MDDIFKDDDKYLRGKENWLIRAYFYCNNGLNVLNQFRNLFLGIIAIYIALKLDNYLWLILMVIPCIIILTLIGFYYTHRAGRVQEWLGVRFSSSFGLRSFNYTQQTYEVLLEIKNLLQNEKIRINKE